MRCTVARARRFDAAFKETSPTGKLTNQLAGVNFYYNLHNKLVFQKGTGSSNRHSQDAYYFWLGDIPVGVFNNQGAFNIYADHLNTPRQLFAWDDQWGQPTTRAKWQWSYSPFGDNQPTTDVNHYAEEEAQDLQLPTTARNTSANNPVMDLRYPGQFYDHSTGLHQNWMRMYDPQTARYTRADPIGLNGGMNRYAYVGGNALWAVDARGLYLTMDENTTRVVNEMRRRSKTANEMVTAFEQDKKVNYHIRIHASAPNATICLPAPRNSLWDNLLGKPQKLPTVVVSANSRSRPNLAKEGGGDFAPSIERVLAHEMGHAYTFHKHGYVGSRSRSHDAVDYENKVAKELNPNAPTRSKRDHSDHNPIFDGLF